MAEKIMACRTLGKAEGKETPTEWCITRDDKGTLRLRYLDSAVDGTRYPSDDYAGPADDRGADLDRDEWQAILATLLAAWTSPPPESKA